MKNKKLFSVFIVNLPKDTERKAHMQNLCAQYNLHPELIDAVDGRVLSEGEIAKVYSVETIMRTFGRELSRGEIGVFLSQKSILEKMVRDDIETALIFEDDITFNKDLVELLDMKSEFPKDWELVLLGHHPERSRDIDTDISFWKQTQLLKKYKLGIPCERAMGAYGYLITQTGAKKLLKHLEVITEPVDHFTGDSQYINLYAMSPTPVKIHEYLSESSDSMGERDALKKAKNPQNETHSWKKKIVKSLGLYRFLLVTRDNLKRFMCKAKPLRRYGL